MPVKPLLHLTKSFISWFYSSYPVLSKVGSGRPSKFSVAIFGYQGVIRKAIIALKYKFAADIARELALACVARLKGKWPKLNHVVLIPIPLHSRRENWRGFNQAEEVGKIIASELGWQYKPNLLVRTVNTVPQVGLRGKSRHQNVKDIFTLSSSPKPASKATILVFDDVYTTGSTMREAIKVLRKRGFSRVFGLTIAS